MVLRRVTPDNRDAIVTEAVTILAKGGLVVMPTDTVYGVAAHPDNQKALANLYRLKRRQMSKPIALLLADGATIETLGGRLSQASRRLADNFWPGALTLVIACRDGREGVRVPDHTFARQILAASGGALRVSSVNFAGGPPALTAQQALESIGGEVDLVIDDGTSYGNMASTVVADDGGKLSLLRAGAISERKIEAAAGVKLHPAQQMSAVGAEQKKLLFICSGNTCRSPMAEYLMRAQLAGDNGWLVGSAGTSATVGQSVAGRARQALAECKIEMDGHKSRPLTSELARDSTVIVAMARHHFDRAVSLAAGAHDKVFQLRRFAARPDGRDIPDPIGGSLQEYRDCRDAILECLPALRRFLLDGWR